MGLLSALKLPTPPARAAAAPAKPDTAAAPSKAAASAKRSDSAAGAAAVFERQSHLNEAATDWRDTHAEASARIVQLHDAIKDHYADGHPGLLAEIDSMGAKLNAILDNVDHRLAEALDRAGKAEDKKDYEREAKAARKLVADYIASIKSEPLVAHMDQNPFGVKVGLKALLAGGLGKAAKAIG